MNDTLIRMNCLENFQEKFKEYIEVFVAYYGEDKRKEITEKFSNALPLAYTTPNGLSSLTINLCKEKSNELINKLISNNELYLSEETIFGNGNYEYNNLMPINTYLEFKKMYDLGPKGRQRQAFIDKYNNVKKYIPELTIDELVEMSESNTIMEKYNTCPSWLKNNILANTNLEEIERIYQNKFENAKELITAVSGISSLEEFTNENEKINKFNKLVEDYEETLKEYDKFKQQYQSYFDEVENNSKENYRTRKKYYKELLINSKFLFNEEEQEKINKYISEESYFLDSTIENIIGNSLVTDSNLEKFSQENEEIINENNKEENWRKEYIIKDRIKYFNAKGINLGNNYEDYLNNDEVKKVWPTKEQIDKFKELKEKYYNQAEQEYYENTNIHKKLRKLVDSKNYILPDTNIDTSLYQSALGKTFVSPNLTKDYKLSPIVCVCFNENIGITEHFIIHELNHLFELSFDSIVDNKARFICGWDIIEDETNEDTKDYLSPKQQDDQKRDYELFNEIINELIAQEIHTNMREKNMHVLDEKSDSRISHLTSYESSLFLVREFYNEFKDEIIKSRSNGNIKEIFDAVGKENFDELNSLFEIYYENFSGMKYYSLLSSLKEKKENKMTQIYYELLDRKEKILENMRTVRDLKSKENLSI